MKVLKIIGIAILLTAMAYASNWDLPTPDKEYSREYQEAFEYYMEHKDDTGMMIIDGVIIEGQYIDGMWYEGLELWKGSLPSEVLEHAEL